MATRVTLTIIDGSLRGKGFNLEKRGRYVIGRADDCDIQLSGGQGLMGVSRHHCVLAFDPPTLRVRDLGSRNGTFVNAEKIGQRMAVDPLDGDELGGFAEHELKDGDELRIGGFGFLVRIREVSDKHEVVCSFPVNLG
jgi:eukaryotic-like serine/threonine-protein kinase